MKPKPVIVTTICSECGLGWELHGENPTTSDCVRLLKAELAKRPHPTTIINYPYYWQWQQYPYTYTNTVLCSSTATGNCSASELTNTLNDGHTITVNTPANSTITCSAVNA